MSESIILGGGCFWCTEAVYKNISGIMSVNPGYAGGSSTDPTYEQVCKGDTGHAEVIRIEFNPEKISLLKLLDVFFSTHDATQLNRQGGDVGSQYRSIILYKDDSQKKTAEKIIYSLGYRVSTEVKMLVKFYPAEEYHKDYFAKNPLQPYCLMAIRPKVAKSKKLHAALYS